MAANWSNIREGRGRFAKYFVHINTLRGNRAPPTELYYMWYRTVIASGTHTSAIVALFLPRKDARKLVLNPKSIVSDDDTDVDLEKPSDLHITLAFLGKVTEIADKKEDIVAALKLLAKQTLPITGNISGTGFFQTQKTKNEDSAFYASYDSAQLFEFRNKLIEALTIAGIKIDDTHGFTPHITLSYLPKDVNVDNYIPPHLNITFPSITLAWAGKQTHFELTGE